MILLDDENLEDIGLGFKIVQSKKHYRFSVDSVLLANFVEVNSGECVVDLGTGSGIIPLLLSQKDEQVKIVGIEFQQSLAQMAKKSVRYNNQDSRITIIEGDLKESPFLLKGVKWDKVVSNPPYFRKEDTRISPKKEIAIARHEIKCNLEDVVKAASLLLKPGGGFYLVHRYERLTEILTFSKKYELYPARLQTVSVNGDTQPHLILAKFLYKVEKECRWLSRKYLKK